MSPLGRVDGWPQECGGSTHGRGLSRRWTLIGEIIDLSVEYVARVYLAVARRLWKRLPETWRRSGPGTAYGAQVHSLVLRHQPREQSHGTFFFRNRPELELLKRLLDGVSQGSRLDLSILGCSKGAEVYSFAWAIRSTRRDVKLALSAVDISQDILDFAKEGIYSLAGQPAEPDAVIEDGGVSSGTHRDQRNVSIFDRVTDREMQAIFDVEGDRVAVKPWLKEGISWRRGDVASPEFAHVLGAQDIVVANRFLCHMKPEAAERCLRSIARLVKPGGYLFVSGVDLDVRTRVARDGGWTPIEHLLEEIHGGDPSLMSGWPLEYWSVEPFQARRSDRDIRYAAVFRLDKS